MLTYASLVGRYELMLQLAPRRFTGKDRRLELFLVTRASAYVEDWELAARLRRRMSAPDMTQWLKDFWGCELERS